MTTDNPASSIRSRISGRVVPVRGDDIDTDRIIPARYLRTVTFDGLGEHVFEDDRASSSHVFDDANYAGATVLVANENFGCGSSREHAPWALSDFGIRCVIAPSFADIFYNNSFKNGMLLIALPQKTIDKMMLDAENGENARLSVDLETQQITRPDGEIIDFEVDAFKKHCLLNGLDDIELTMQKEDKINAFEDSAKVSQPWL